MMEGKGEMSFERFFRLFWSYVLRLSGKYQADLAEQTTQNGRCASRSCAHVTEEERALLSASVSWIYVERSETRFL